VNSLALRYSWATSDQLECIQLFCDLVGGHDNLQGRFVGMDYRWVCINQKRSFATHDDNWLTKAVFLAHERGIRVAMESAGQGVLRVSMRKTLPSDLTGMHPTLQNAIDSHRCSSIAKPSVSQHSGN